MTVVGAVFVICCCLTYCRKCLFSEEFAAAVAGKHNYDDKSVVDEVEVFSTFSVVTSEYTVKRESIDT